jgi:glycosyltransferase involved in cell wall biosynthesis
MADVVMLRTRPFPPEPRGLREARALRDAGFTVEVVAWDRAREFTSEETIDGIGVRRVRIPCGQSLFPAYLLALPLYWLLAIPKCLRPGVRAIHCADLDTLPAGLLAKKLRGSKVVYDAYEDYAGMVSASVPRSIASLLSRLDRRLSRGADLVITVSPPLLDRYSTAREVLLVPNAAEPEEFDRVTEEQALGFRREHGVGVEFLILFVGVLMPGRGIEQCIAAVEGMESVKFLIGGFGQLEDEVNRLAASSKNSAFIGRVRPEDVPVAVRAADALAEVLDPSNGTYRVSMPNKLFESICGAVPIIVSKETYPGKFVEEHGLGLAVPYGDISSLREAIQRLVREKGSAARREAASRSRERYAWKTFASALADAYRRLLR